MRTIDEALTYFKGAEMAGYYTPTAQELSEMTEKEIIKLADYCGERGDYYANELEGIENV